MWPKTDSCGGTHTGIKTEKLVRIFFGFDLFFVFLGNLERQTRPSLVAAFNSLTCWVSMDLLLL